MWLCWLPVLMDALTSVSQHCGGNRGGVVLVSLCDFPLQPDTAACGETFSHHAHEHDSGGAFEKPPISFVLNQSSRLPHVGETAKLKN